MTILLHILVVILLILFMALLVSSFLSLAAGLKENRRSGRLDAATMLSLCAAMLGSVGFLLLLPYALIAGRWVNAGDGGVLSVQLVLFLLVAALPFLFVMAAGKRGDVAKRGRQREKIE